MSLVSTYVQSKEGNWYKNPVITGPGYFVCWDDDEPIELVVELKYQAADIINTLYKAGWSIKMKQLNGRAERMFEDGEFRPAKSYFVMQLVNGPPDALLPQNTRVENHSGDCVVYFNTRNGH